MNIIKKATLALAITAGIATTLACGSASNNDQGVSFTALGWAVPDDEGVCVIPPLYVTAAVISLSGGISAEGYFSSYGTFICFAVRNNMTSQGIRADRMYYSFHVPGASEQPPSTSVPFTAVLNPISTGDAAATDDELAATGLNIGAQLLPPQILEWMNLNRGSLPEPPFTVEGTYYVSGITTAGDRLDSNVVNMNFVVTEDNIIPPTEGPGDTPPVEPTAASEDDTSGTTGSDTNTGTL